MGENLMVGSHKYSNKKWRDNYDRIFNKRDIHLQPASSINVRCDMQSKGMSESDERTEGRRRVKN